MLLILEKEPRLSCKCLEAVCNYLPQSHESNTPKEVLLIAELAEIMKVMQPEDLQGTMPLLVRHMVRLFTSQNAQTLQSVLQFWKDERVSQLLSHFANQLIPNLMPMLLRDGELFWNPTVNKMTSLVLEKLEEADPEVQLQQSEMRCKMQREEAEEWKEESRRFEKELLHQRSSFVQGGQELQQEFLMERRKLLEKVAQGESAQEQAFQAERLRAIRAEERCQVQETLHQAELARLTARYEKALLRCSSEQARLLSRYEKEKEEWAADWKEVNDIMQPLIQTHEAAEVQRVTRQAAAQEGLNLLKQFAQLKELETQELKRGRQASEVMAVRLDAERTESRAESGAESAEDHQEQTCEGAELRGPGGPSAQ